MRLFFKISDDDVAPTLFSYDIEELWAFKKDFDNPMMVTGLDWNPYNPVPQIK